MNFYQRMYGLVSLLFTGMTAMLIFVFIESPYTNLFKIETTAILFAELLIGLCIVYNVRKNDSVMIHAAGYTVAAVVYLLFTLFMIYFACDGMEQNRFLAVHIAGFCLAVILMLFFAISEHHINDQDQQENEIRKQRIDLRGTMQDITVFAESAFADNRSLLAKFHKLADDVRFLPDPAQSDTARDREIEEVLAALKQAAKNKNQAVFSETLEHLVILFKVRENRI